MDLNGVLSGFGHLTRTMQFRNTESNDSAGRINAPAKEDSPTPDIQSLKTWKAQYTGRGTRLNVTI